ncbi:MAG: hypothetical protein RR986_07365 [Longicatena sp.]
MGKMKCFMGIVVCSLLVCIFPVNVSAQQGAEPKQNDSRESIIAFFNLNDSKEQSITVYDERGEAFDIKMLPNLEKEYLPLGSFSRRFEATGFSTTMSAKLIGITNPYVSTISSVSDGLFNATILTWLKDSYFIENSSTTSNSSPASARYTATFTSYIGNTATRSLRFSLYLNGYIEVSVTYA